MAKGDDIFIGLVTSQPYSFKLLSGEEVIAEIVATVAANLPVVLVQPKTLLGSLPKQTLEGVVIDPTISMVNFHLSSDILSANSATLYPEDCISVGGVNDAVDAVWNDLLIT